MNPSSLHITGPEDTIAGLISIADCDRAINALTLIIADIEVRLEDPQDDAEWRRRARKALTLRRSALAYVYVRRKELRQDHQHEWNRAFVEEIKRLQPDLFYAVAGERAAA